MVNEFIPIKNKHELKKCYFNVLSKLQKKYDVLLAEYEKQVTTAPSKNERKTKNKQNRIAFTKQLSNLEKQYNKDKKKLINTFTTKSQNRKANFIEKVKLKTIKKQYKKDKQTLRFSYYLKTIDPIRAKYIMERNQLTLDYRHQLKKIKHNFK
ncbi:MAG: hypothetical protein LBP70_00075 [Mycoplasmataceae bacterium]|jgi:hypothetical protein|nr:hypothetical protein [Mycoplasmataceae bacterium]